MSILSDAAAKAAELAKAAGKAAGSAAVYTAQQALGAKNATDAINQSLGIKATGKAAGKGAK